MLPRRILDCVVTPDGRELVLYRRGDTYLIEIDAYELMTSRAHGSEEELARRALAALDGRPPRVLVGGLGMGFTLRAALDVLAARPAAGQRGAAVVVAEVFPAVVEWNRRWLGELAGRPLDDPRAKVEVADVAELLTGRPPWDVILLDVDNGAEALTLDRNRNLYSRAGVERLHRALAPGGVLAVWSTAEDEPFADRLRRGGFTVATHRVPARAGGKGGRHVVFVARRGTRTGTG